MRGHSSSAGMYCLNHWIPRPSFQTRLYHPALAGAPPEEGNWNYLGGLFQTPLYRLHPSPLSFQRKLESRKAGQDVKRMMLFGLEG